MNQPIHDFHARNKIKKKSLIFSGTLLSSRKDYTLWWSHGKLRENNSRKMELLFPITGRGSFTDLRSERQTRRIIEIPHNGRSCFSLHPPGSTTPSTCVYNPEASARAHAPTLETFKKIPCVYRHIVWSLLSNDSAYCVTDFCLDHKWKGNTYKRFDVQASTLNIILHFMFKEVINQVVRI